MNPRAIAVVTGFVWTELRRSHLAWFVPGLILTGLALASFVASLTLTESADYRVLTYAASMRLAAVFVTMLWVVSATLRAIDEREVDTVLSRPVSRSDWYLGRLGGALGAVVLMSAALCLPLLPHAPVAALAWALSLACELAIVTAAGLAFAITLRQVPVAVSAVAAFYLLGRTIAAIVLMSTGPAVDTASAATRFVAAFLALLERVLPDLDRFTASVWLIDGVPPASDLGWVVAQGFVYTGLLVAVGLFDLHRRNF